MREITWRSEEKLKGRMGASPNLRIKKIGKLFSAK